MNRMVIIAWLLGSVLLPVRFIRAADRIQVDFNRQILPIFADNCFICHGPDERDREGDLRLDQPIGPAEGRAVIVPGDPQRSELFRRICSDDPDSRMPPAQAGHSLKADEIQLIRRWIEQGGSWQTHWAYLPPGRPNRPEVRLHGWPSGPIDEFTLAKLEQHGWQPSRAAPRWQWLRRVMLDVTGLPPTVDELHAFSADASPDARQRVVDRLLSSARYGERMALTWLDLARYADTHGYHADSHRDMWRWREWVINSFNDNLPFDQFTVWQIAGDLLPQATLEQHIATGFNRNHMINFENGAIDEEYRVEYVADRVATTTTVWLGQTMQCARCHDHKYDPLSQRDYFRLFAYFNNIDEKGLDGKEGNAEPWLKAPTRLQQMQLEELDAQTNTAEQQLRRREREARGSRLAWEKDLRAGNLQIPSQPSDALAHYPLDEQRGSLAHDATGRNDPAQVRGSEIWLVDAGKFAGTMVFNDQTYLDCGDVADFDRLDSFSYGAWIFPTTGGEMTVIARVDNRNGRRGYDLSLENGQLCAHLVHQLDTNAIRVVSKQAVAMNVWHHVMVTYDGSSSAAGVKIYLDGTPQGLDVQQDHLTAEITTEHPLHIGRRSTSAPFRGLIDDVRLYQRALGPIEVGLLAGSNPIESIVQLDSEQRTPTQQNMLERYYLQQIDRPYRQLRLELDRLDRLRVQKREQVSTTMVMKELESPRSTFVLARGDYRNPTDQVTPGAPTHLPPLPADAPSNRLGLANWLIAPENPLTARVTVNRFWQIYFGAGLVRTSEDFGTRGERPSHPKLLDWLATELRQDWNVKRLQRQMLLSSTYGQSSQITPELAELDPDNRLLTRGPRFRLQAELVRDAALNAGGLLSERLGGKSVYPYQPSGLWREVSYDPRDYSAQVYVPSRGADLFRRSMYTFWKRSVPPPALSTMGAPDREVCTTRRVTTSSPLDALVLMNDPTYVEAARGLAQRMLQPNDWSGQERITYGFRIVTSRMPTAEEVSVLQEVLTEQLRRFANQPAAATALIAVGESKPHGSCDATQLASYTVIASMLLNLHETTTRG